MHPVVDFCCSSPPSASQPAACSASPSPAWESVAWEPAEGESSVGEAVSPYATPDGVRCGVLAPAPVLPDDWPSRDVVERLASIDACSLDGLLDSLAEICHRLTIEASSVDSFESLLPDLIDEIADLRREVDAQALREGEYARMHTPTRSAPQGFGSSWEQLLARALAVQTDTEKLAQHLKCPTCVPRETCASSSMLAEE